VPPHSPEFNGGTVPSYQQVINLLDKVYLLRSMTGVGEFCQPIWTVPRPLSRHQERVLN
jgi:hypothetical protein